MNVIDIKSTYDSRVISGVLAFWRFKQGANEQSFMAAFEEFIEMVNRPNITRLVVSVEMDDPWSRDIQHLWLKTGEIGDQAGLSKWGIYVPEHNCKRPTIRYLVSGAGNHRSYEYFIGSDEKEVVDWALS